MSRTLVAFHAHPDDESITTGGTMARLASEGHRVVLVLATRGELGEVVDGVLRDGEALWQRRVEETHRAAEILGVARVEFLGYRDSGMMGEPGNHAPGSFWSASVDEAATRLARLLDEEGADGLTVYDENGGYGHPDHIQVHRVGVRAAEMTGTPFVYEATLNRDAIARLVSLLPAEERPDGMPDFDASQFGSPESVITTTLDVSGYVTQKREAMRAHASQIPADSWFLQMPADRFAAAFGTEWFVRRGAPPGTREDLLFAGLE